MKSNKMLLLGLATVAMALIITFLWHSPLGKPPGQINSREHSTAPGKKPRDNRQPFDLDTAMAKKPKDYSKILPESLAPEEAKDLIDEFFQKFPGITERTRFCNAIIQNLCERGYTEEAWNLIDENPGQIRSNELFTFFEAAKGSSDDLLGRLASMDSDLGDCFGGYLKRYRPDQLGTVLSSPELAGFLQKIGPDKTRRLNIDSRTALALHLSLPSDGSDPTPVLQSAAQLNASGKLSSEGLMSLMAKSPSLSALDKWSYVKEVDREVDSTPRARRDRDTLISEMVGANGPAALAAILELSGHQHRQDIETAIKSWINIDTKGVSEWHQRNQSSISQENRNIIASAFSSEALNSLEFETAKSWADQIRDPELKSQAIKLIEDKTTEYQKAQARDSTR